MISPEAISALPPFSVIQAANTSRVGVTEHIDGFSPDPRVLEIGTSQISLRSFMAGFVQRLSDEMEEEASVSCII